MYHSILRHYLVILIVVIGYGSVTHAQENRVSLITFGPGDDTYDCFGHTAIRVKGQTASQDWIYNYGTYDFDQPNFYTNFLRGKLLYSLSRQRYGPTLNVYNRYQRSVYEQQLNLTAEQELKLINSLETNYLPDNRNYLYEFFFDNCSTRPRDMILDVTGELNYQIQEDNYTFRDLIHRATVRQPWTQFGMDLIVGSRADASATLSEQMYIPERLMTYFGHAETNNGPLVAQSYTVLDFEDVQERRKQTLPPWPLIIFFLVFLLEVFLFLKMERSSKAVKVYDKVWFFLLGIAGLVILVMWFLTEHYSTKANYNLLLFNPIWFLPMLKKPRKALVLLLLTMIICLSIVNLIGWQDIPGAVIVIGAISILKLARPFRVARLNKP